MLLSHMESGQETEKQISGAQLTSSFLPQLREGDPLPFRVVLHTLVNQPPLENSSQSNSEVCYHCGSESCQVD